MIIIICLSLLFFIIDQVSKSFLIRLIDMSESLEIIKNFFYLTYTHNTGAAFSIFSGQRIFLIIIAILILVVLFSYIKQNSINSNFEKISLSLIIGGSLGNLIDRIFRGYVIDFFDVKIFGYNFPIFNIADCFIVIGVFLLFILTFRREYNDDNRK